MSQLSDLLELYREAVLHALQVAPAQERSLYAGHVRELDRLSALVSSSSESDALAAVVSSERRAFGWSFLPGAYGARVESAFHAFASFAEHSGSGERHGA